MYSERAVYLAKVAAEIFEDIMIHRGKSGCVPPQRRSKEEVKFILQTLIDMVGNCDNTSDEQTVPDIKLHVVSYGELPKGLIEDIFGKYPER